MITIYLITCNGNGKHYVGQTRQSLKSRIGGFHWYKKNKDFNNDFIKYGKEAFVVEKICEADSQESADKLERFYIKRYDSIKNGYNHENGGIRNFKTADSTKEKLSKALKGKRNSIRTEFKKNDPRIIKHYVMKEETKIKLSKNHKGRHLSKRTEFTPERCSGSLNSRAYPVFQYALDGSFIAKYATAKEASLLTGSSRSGICSCRNGNRKTCNGFIWKNA